MKLHIFLCELAFRPQEISEFAQGNPIFLKPLSKVNSFNPTSEGIRVDTRNWIILITLTSWSRVPFYKTRPRFYKTPINSILDYDNIQKLIFITTRFTVRPTHPIQWNPVFTESNALEWFLLCTSGTKTDIKPCIRAFFIRDRFCTEKSPRWKSIKPFDTRYSKIKHSIRW